MRLLSTLLLLSPVAVWAQANVPFAFRFQQGQSLTVVNEGATLTLPADAIGVTSTGTLSITYRGAAGATVSINSADLTGSLDFSVSGLASAPFTVTGGDTFTAGIRYLPTTGNRATARLVVNYTEGRTTSSFTMNLVGTAPEFAFAYTPPGGNTQPLVNGGTISFPQTVIDTTVNATLSITNRGSGPGPISSIGSTGSAFQLVGAPLPGAILEAGREARVGIAFTPRQAATATGAVNVELVDRRVSFLLEGTGAASQFVYEVVDESGTRPVAPEQTIALPDTPVNERRSVTVRVRNAGTADGRITAITASGTGVSVSDLPVFPAVLTPGSRFSITINFAPAAPGRITGRLRIGQDEFDLTGQGLGPVLSYASIIGGVSTTVSANGSVNFVSTQVGASSTVQFEISNTGTAPGSVSAVSISTANAVFELSSMPALPATLQPGAAIRFGVVFAPTAVGPATALLRVDTQTFTLNGVGSSPAPLPGYSFSGASGTLDPLAQPTVSLQLAQPYPLTLSGTVTLAFSSDVFANDPSVQFASGGRTVAFTIPANTRQAIFPNNATSVRLQTGTVAGTLSLSPTFVTDGGINLTPARPDTLNLTVAPAAPRLLSVAIASRTGNVLTLLVTGYATSRSVTQMELAFTPVSGETLTTQRLTLNAEAAFLAWYQSQPSAQFGSLFSATVPLTLSGEVNATTFTSLIDAIQSVAVTISNRQGASQPVSLNLR